MSLYLLIFIEYDYQCTSIKMLMLIPINTAGYLATNEISYHEDALIAAVSALIPLFTFD
jgi:hypothetical protein